MAEFAAVLAGVEEGEVAPHQEHSGGPGLMRERKRDGGVVGVPKFLWVSLIMVHPTCLGGSFVLDLL